MKADTIAALATPPGVGGIGVIRISGPGVTAISLTLIGQLPRPRYATLCRFLDASRNAIDQGLALFFRGPHSFTGEDSLELHGHGGPVVLDLLLSRCLELGARLAGPGEFTQRAYLNGKLDLLQAEAIADLIESSTTLAARLSMRSLQGVFSRRIGSLVADLTELRALLEATLDFPDDEIDAQSRDQFSRRLATLRSAVSLILSEATQGERIRDGLTVVIAGRPNAGKSSLLNALLQYDAAIVTPVPGTTRDLLRCDMQIDGLPVRLIDTAGICETTDLVEQEGVRRARGELEKADLVLWVYDGSCGLGPEEVIALPPTIPLTFVANKADLQPQADERPSPAGVATILVSALTGFGVTQLRQHLKAKAGVEGLGDGAFVARRRHLDALRRGMNAIDLARSALGQDSGGELVAFELVEAQRALGEVTGDFTPDDLLGQIFSTFCIGK